MQSPVIDAGQLRETARERDRTVGRRRSPDRYQRIARMVLAQMRARRKFLPEVTYEDPEWLMLLELFIAMASGRKVTVSGLCSVSGVPSTTALRHMRLLEKNGLVTRSPAPRDRRVSFVQLHEDAVPRLHAYLDSIAPQWLPGNDELLRG